MSGRPAFAFEGDTQVGDLPAVGHEDRDRGSDRATNANRREGTAEYTAVEMVTNENIDDALLGVRNLIERFRSGRTSPEKERPFDDGGMAFIVPGLGGMRLTGDEADRFRECLGTLLELDHANPQLRRRSHGAVEGALRTAVLGALFPGQTEDESPESYLDRIKSESRAPYQGRLESALSELRKFICSPLAEWALSIPVSGFTSAALPLKFGGVTLVEKAGDDVESALRNSLGYVQEARDSAVASLLVWAKDRDAAVQVGMERLRRTIDILNFYAGFFTKQRRRYRGYISADGKRRPEVRAVRLSGSSGGYGWGSSRAKGDPIDVHIDPASERAQAIGFSRVDEMLALDDPSDLQQRLLTALGWAGRAQTELRREESFLLLAIAFEGLLAKEDARTGNTERLAVRVAHVLGRSLEGRRALADEVRSLYDVRSRLIHTGNAIDLQDEEVETIRDLVDRLATVLLADTRFKGMKSVRELEQWFDDRLLGSDPKEGSPA